MPAKDILHLMTHLSNQQPPMDTVSPDIQPLQMQNTNPPIFNTGLQGSSTASTSDIVQPLYKKFRRSTKEPLLKSIQDNFVNDRE